jgi:hypothetical protein
MSHPRRGCPFAGALAALAGLLCLSACDPSEIAPVGSNGPPFLILGEEPRPAESPEAGTALYLQGRGGNYVGIVTHGCTHSFADYTDVTESCGLMPYYGGAALYFTADPEDDACYVEAQLYYICDCPEAGVPVDVTSGVTAYQWCYAEGTPIATQSILIGPPGADAASIPDTGDDGGSDSGDDGGGPASD